MRKLIVPALWLFLGFSCSREIGSRNALPASSLVTPDVFRELITYKRMQLVDVRTRGEHARGHILGSIQMDFNDPAIRDMVSSRLDSKRPVALYCRLGKRSAAAFSLLQEMGFTHVYDLKGGILAWESGR